MRTDRISVNSLDLRPIRLAIFSFVPLRFELLPDFQLCAFANVFVFHSVLPSGEAILMIGLNLNRRYMTQNHKYVMQFHSVTWNAVGKVSNCEFDD